MGAFLTGFATAALLLAATWVTLDTYTVTTIERYDTTSVSIRSDDSRGEFWK